MAAHQKAHRRFSGRLPELAAELPYIFLEQETKFF